jgi:hypothetical protein
MALGCRVRVVAGGAALIREQLQVGACASALAVQASRGVLQLLTGVGMRYPLDDQTRWARCSLGCAVVADAAAQLTWSVSKSGAS